MKPNPAAIRKLRKASGLTLQSLGKRTFLSHTYLSRLEHGERGADEATLRRIAEALDADIHMLTLTEEAL